MVNKMYCLKVKEIKELKEKLSVLEYELEQFIHKIIDSAGNKDLTDSQADLESLNFDHEWPFPPPIFQLISEHLVNDLTQDDELPFKSVASWPF